MTPRKLIGRSCVTLAGLIVAACVVYDTWENAMLRRQRVVKDAHWDELAGQARDAANQRGAA